MYGFTLTTKQNLLVSDREIEVDRLMAAGDCYGESIFSSDPHGKYSPNDLPSDLS